MPGNGLKVNVDRLRADIEALAAIGRRDDLGLYRMAFTEADMSARNWLQQRIRDAGLEIHVDGAANIFGRLGWDAGRPCVMMGSHIDTVPGAGHLDGALGVLVALESLRCLRESGMPLRRPLEMAAFTDEEGRFGGMLGSQAVCGRLTPKSLHNACDLDGVTLIEAMAAYKLDAMEALRAQRRPGSIHAYLELHIEQGPVLDRRRVGIGVVEGIVGLLRWQVTLIGAANHAGTTPMDMRRDAFAGLAEMSLALPRVLEEYGSPHSVATIGRVQLFPGAANVVPGRVEFSLEFRDTDSQVIADLAIALRRTMSAISRRRDLMFEFEVVSEIAPVRCDTGIMRSIEEAARELNASTLRMASGAAHDTQMIAQIAPAGMIFVPSKDGRSHSPAEWTAWEDIETGANVALHTLARLAA